MKRDGASIPIASLLLIAAGMLFWALDGHPRGYFQLLRWITCIAGIFGAVWCYNDWPYPSKHAVWLLAAIAVLFNPIAPIYLDRKTWVVIDPIVGGIFIVMAVAATGYGLRR